mmetsp:Transcript_8091/g.10238  ORF Transcript_8091/g.10238 Transcript_8091/m.10238 type:complete len:97 (-) Transcript_8091:869-1159(-)
MKQRIRVSKSKRSTNSTFLDLWERCRHKIPNMEKTKFLQCLEFPQLQISSYVTTFMEIRNRCEPNSQDYQNAYEAIERVQVAAKQLTEASMMNLAV